MTFQQFYNNRFYKLLYAGGILLLCFLIGFVTTFLDRIYLLALFGLIIITFLLIIFLKKHETGWLLFAALLPFWVLGTEFRVSIGTKLHLDLSMIVLLLLGIAFLLFFLLKGRFQTNNIPNFWLVYLLFIVHIFSLLYGLFLYGEAEWGFKIIITLIFGIFLYILMALTIRDPEFLEKMFKFTFISASILLLFLIYRYLFVFHSPFLGNNIFIPTELGKSKLAIFLTLFTPLMLSYTVFHKNWKSFGGTFIFLGSLIYTLCRGACLAVFVAIIFLLIISKYRKDYFKFLIFIMIIMGIFLTTLVPQITHQFIEETGRGIRLEGSSVEDRIEWISGGLNSFFAHPIFGIGLGNFRKLQFSIPPYTECISHNDYIQILVEQGLIGTLVFLFLFGSILIGLLKTLRRKVDKTRWLQEGITASIISMMVFFLTLNLYDVFPVWFILGCSAVIFNLIKNKN